MELERREEPRLFDLPRARDRPGVPRSGFSLPLVLRRLLRPGHLHHHDHLKMARHLPPPGSSCLLRCCCCAASWCLVLLGCRKTLGDYDTCFKNCDVTGSSMPPPCTLCAAGARLASGAAAGPRSSSGPPPFPRGESGAGARGAAFSQRRWPPSLSHGVGGLMHRDASASAVGWGGSEFAVRLHS